MFVMKILEDERYIVIKAYKLRDFLYTIIYCVSMLFLHIHSTDSMIILWKLLSLIPTQ